MGVSSEYTTKEQLISTPTKPYVRGCSMVYTGTDHDHPRDNVAEFRHFILSET